MIATHRRIAWYVFAASWLVYAATTGGTMATNDAVSIYESAKSLIDKGTLDVPASQSTPNLRGIDGRYYVPYGIGQTLYDVPFILAGRAVAGATGLRLGNDDAVPKAAVTAGSTVAAAATVAFAFLIAWRLSGDLAASVITSFVVAFGTLLWPYSKFGFNAALTAAALAAGVYGLATGTATRAPGIIAAGAASLGFAMLVRHELVIGATACLLWLTWNVRHHPRRRSLIVVAATPIVLAALVEMAFNAFRFGDPLWTGYQPAFSAAGFSAFLLSPSGSVLLYSPIVVSAIGLVTLTRAGNATAALLLLVSAALFVFYASLDDWLGTRSYGPRYLVPLLALVVAPLAVWIARARTTGTRLLLAGLCLLSVAVQLPGIALDFSRVGIEAGQPPQTMRRDEWRWSPMRLNVVAASRLVPEAVVALAANRPTAVAANDDADRALASRVPFGLDFWWMQLFQLRVLPAAVAVGMPVLLLAAGAWCAMRAFRLARATRPAR